MKRLLSIISLLLVAVTAMLVLTSCGQRTDFEQVEVITTTKPVTEPVTYVYSDLDVFGTRMGMSLEETQQALDTNIEVRFTESGQVYFAISKNDLDFIDAGLEAAVYFIYDLNVRLCEVQYVSSNDTGFVLADVLKKFDSLYGDHVEVKKDVNTNYVWYKDGDYIVVTVRADGQNAISFFAEDYFVATQPEDAQTYNSHKAEE